jgi:phage internal scaffolding protein
MFTKVKFPNNQTLTLMPNIGFKTPYSGSRYRVSLECGPGLAQQHFKDECDVNRILSKYQKTGLIDHVNHFQGDYADLSAVPDFQESLNAVLDAQAAFDTLPSTIRKQFDNDPAAFLDFVHNPDNRDEMVKMGLAKAPAPIDEPVAPVVPPVESPAPVVKPVAETKPSA